MQTGTRSRVRRARRRDADIPSLLRTRHKIAEAHGYASKADIARIEIVFQHGGIYLDCDMMPLRRFDFWSLRPSLLVCHEQPLDTGADDDACSTGFFAAPPGHPVLRQAIESLRMQTLNQQAPNIETGPGFFGRMIRSGDVQRLPTAMFYPFSGQEPRCVLLDRLSDDSCAAHMWGGSWTDDADRYWRARALFEASGDLEEASGILAGLDSHLARKLRSRLSAVRRARTLAEWITRPLEGLARCVPMTRADNALRWAEQVLREPGSQVIGIGPRAGRLIEGLAPVLAESPAPLRWDDEHGQPRTLPHRGVATSPRGRHTVLLAMSRTACGRPYRADPGSRWSNRSARRWSPQSAAAHGSVRQRTDDSAGNAPLTRWARDLSLAGIPLLEARPVSLHRGHQRDRDRFG